MNTEEKKKTTDVLLESSVKIKVGLFSYRIKPLTLAQIYEMSIFANDIIAPEWNEGDKVNILHELFKHGNDAKLMCEIFLVCAFRKKYWRKIWGRYIRNRLNITQFNLLVRYISMSFNANFFLTSITFLSQTKRMTEPITTARGQQSEE